MWLFSYGTLRQEQVQLAVFGRLLPGESDELRGFELGEVAITDPEVLVASGLAVHTILRQNVGASDAIPGTALKILSSDLAAVDAYEGANYDRIEVTLASGRAAFVYVQPASRDG